jgi:hypothetical protein
MLVLDPLPTLDCSIDTHIGHAMICKAFRRTAVCTAQSAAFQRMLASPRKKFL